LKENWSHRRSGTRWKSSDLKSHRANRAIHIGQSAIWNYYHPNTP
jgi:hypothetical protein